MIRVDYYAIHRCSSVRMGVGNRDEASRTEVLAFSGHGFVVTLTLKNQYGQSERLS